jgi:ADP-ribose pyrophosphatase
VPAGRVEEGELPIKTAERELIEETGMAAGVITPVGFIYSSPGFTDEKIWLFEAKNLMPPDKFKKDPDEVIEVAELTVK